MTTAALRSRRKSRRSSWFRGPATDHLVLIPGFLASSHASYFCGVEETLQEALGAAGRNARFTVVMGRVSGSLRHRAAELMRVLHAETRREERIHLVGHSTGGLDARLALSPGARLGLSFDPQPLVERVSSLVTVATPHRGVPLASYAAGTLGGSLLGFSRRLMESTLDLAAPADPKTVAWVRWLGRILDAPVRSISSQTRVAAVVDQLIAIAENERRVTDIRRLVRHLEADRGVLLQLTPAALDLFDAATQMPRHVRRGSVVVASPPPDAKANDLYAWLYGMGARNSQIPPLEEPSVAELATRFGAALCPGASDGVVPIASQLWGELIWAGCADHLDVIGFHGESDAGDLLESRSGFGRAAFARLWGRVARYLAYEPDEDRPTLAQKSLTKSTPVDALSTPCTRVRVD